MEHSNWLYQEILTQASNFIWSIFSNGLLFGFIGLCGGIALVVFMSKRKLFKRSHSLWTFVAKLNYVYTPICLALLMAAMGVIFGAQKQVNRWIDSTTQPIVTYSTVILPTLASLDEQLDRSLTLEEMVIQEFGMNEEEAGYKGQAYNRFNTVYVKAILAELGYPLEIDGLIRMLREKDLSQVSAASLQGIPVSIKRYCGSYFWAGYVWIWMVFLPFLLIPVGELLIFLIVDRHTPKMVEVEPPFPGPDLPNLEAELV
jgi:hypothetical protein